MTRTCGRCWLCGITPDLHGIAGPRCALRREPGSVEVIAVTVGRFQTAASRFLLRRRSFGRF
jgi:hypothetical protein